MTRNLIIFSAGLFLVLSSACTKQDQKDPTLFCQAMSDNDLLVAGYQIDEQAKDQTNAEWEVNTQAVADWLESQDCVKEATTSFSGLIETLPPQTEIAITMDDDKQWIIDLYVDEANGNIWFNRFHE
ncbi:MAG: hypothetical protein K9I85_14725 [Saprospiraceae bacterium]|nr:hypothetical protein [Saprospiraceae bacterium]